jgi:hypothetical protein
MRGGRRQSGGRERERGAHRRGAHTDDLKPTEKHAPATSSVVDCFTPVFASHLGARTLAMVVLMVILGSVVANLDLMVVSST